MAYIKHCSDAQPSSSRRISPCRDDKTIDVAQVQDVRMWSIKFGVSAQSLMEAVKTVGTNPGFVQRHLHAAEDTDPQRH